MSKRVIIWRGGFNPPSLYHTKIWSLLLEFLYRVEFGILNDSGYQNSDFGSLNDSAKEENPVNLLQLRTKDQYTLRYFLYTSNKMASSRKRCTSEEVVNFFCTTEWWSLLRSFTE